MFGNELSCQYLLELLLPTFLVGKLLPFLDLLPEQVGPEDALDLLTGKTLSELFDLTLNQDLHLHLLKLLM